MVTKVSRSASRRASAVSVPASAAPGVPPHAVKRRRAQRMSKVDTAWLRMDSDVNLMMILGVWVLKPGIRYADLCQRVSERLLPIARFTQRVRHDAAGARWETDPDFDLARHVVPEHLAPARPVGQRRRSRAASEAADGAAEKAALQARVAELAMQPLDADHPLWQLHWVETYDGGSALIARIHHCIADGIALITVMLGMVDGATGPDVLTRTAHVSEQDDPQSWVTDSLVKPLTQMTVKALDAAGDGLAKSISMLEHPRHGADAAMHFAWDVMRMGGRVTQDAAALLFMPDDSPTALKASATRPLAAHKAVAWCEPIPLDEVKAIGKALGCSVNDVLLSAVAGALGHYLRDMGDAVTGKELRAFVPVNLRPLEEAWKLGNRFGLVPLELPIGIDNPIERVYVVRQRMQALKGSTQPLLAFALLSVAGLVVKPAQEALLGMFSRKTTAVMTNVPGPAEKLSFCGATLEQVMFWVPQSGDIGVGVSILSYGGSVQFGLMTDVALCSQPQAIIDQFRPQFDSLSWLAMMLPWDGQL